MKIIKISLAAIVLLAICFCVWYFLGGNLNIPTPIGDEQHLDIQRINQSIANLGEMPSDSFCKDLYDDIQADIADCHSQHILDRKDSNNNNQTYINLSSDLYAIYVPKFIEQCLFVFKGSEWKITDLIFIRSHVQTLISSPYLDHSSPRYQDLQNIGGALDKYDEISTFINDCNNVSYGDISKGFPIVDVNAKINQARYYLDENLENRYVNNCTRLKEGLREIPAILFSKHVNYLDNKFEAQSGYLIYEYYSDYELNVYTRLKGDLDLLVNDIYMVDHDTFVTQKNSLKSVLDAANSEAYSNLN